MPRRWIPLVAVLLVAAAAPALAATPSTEPLFRSYVAPDELARFGGEPSLGVNPRNGSVMYQASTKTLRVDGFDRPRVGAAHWRDVTPPAAEGGTLDPILERDPRTGRTWVSHLTPTCSRMAFTDDDGSSWTDVTQGCSAGAGADHQTVAAGPFPAGTKGASHPSAVYYCANYVAGTSCGVSRDGGRTFGPARPLVGTSRPHTCSLGWGMHVGRDGTAYLPPYSCGVAPGFLQAGVYVSEDAGLTWNEHVVPGSTAGFEASPGVATDSAGALYMVWGGGEGPGFGGPPYVAVSQDKGRSWTRPFNLGAAFGLANTKFTVAVAGAARRAAVAFLGAREPGNDQDDAYRGVWRLYVAFTYDGGRTWRTTNATPHSPVQVGAICVAGFSCGRNRNHFDFNDIAIDGAGRVVVAITDGCPSQMCNHTARERRPTIVRQLTGPGLLQRH